MLNHRALAVSSALLVVLASVLVLSMPGCGGRDGEQKIKIGFLVNHPEEAWYINEWKFAQLCADEKGFELIKIGAPTADKLLSAIDNLGAMGAQGFVVCPPDVSLGPAIVAKAKENGLKVYVTDDRFVGPDGRPMEDVPYMGISATEIGRMVGKELYAEFLQRGWKVEETGVCVITFENLQTAKERTDGAKEALTQAGFPADQIYETPERAEDVPAAMEAALALLAKQPRVKRWLVCASNDEGVMGAVRATEQFGFKPEDVIGIGIGGSTCLVEFQNEKPSGFFATVLISPRRHGYETVEAVYYWVTENKEPAKLTLTNGIFVTRDTYEEVMKEQGLLD